MVVRACHSKPGQPSTGPAAGEVQGAGCVGGLEAHLGMRFVGHERQVWLGPAWSACVLGLLIMVMNVGQGQASSIG